MAEADAAAVDDSGEADSAGTTYADAGVDLDASEAATAAILGALGEFEGEFAGVVDLDDRYLALATDGVGTKLLVAEAIGDHSTVGIDCVAMNANDLIAAGVEPVAFVDYLAVDDPDDGLAREIGDGLAEGVARAGVSLVGGETAVLPDVVEGYDLAGTCAGFAPKDAVFPGEAEPGDALVGWPSSGVHSNGLSLARTVLAERFDYGDPLPWNGDRTVGEALLEPTRIYREVLAPLREHDAHAAAHVTGGGWTNLARMGDFRYVVDDPCPAQSVFGLVRREGNVSDAEMHRTFNMGTGFVAALEPDDAETVVSATDDGRIVGHVEAGEGVHVRGVTLRG